MSAVNRFCNVAITSVISMIFTVMNVFQQTARHRVVCAAAGEAGQIMQIPLKITEIRAADPVRYTPEAELCHRILGRLLQTVWHSGREETAEIPILDMIFIQSFVDTVAVVGAIPVPVSA